MKKIKWMTAMIASGILISCSAEPSVQNNTQENIENTTELESTQEITTILPLSDEQKAQDHITGYLAEHIVVDADLTPYESYSEGLNTYYIYTYQEAEDAANYAENPTFFHQDLESFLSNLSVVLDTDFDQDNMMLDVSELMVCYEIPAIIKNSEQEKSLLFYFDLNSTKNVQRIVLYYSNTGMDAYDDRNNGAEMIAQNPLYNREYLEFADGAELGEQLKNLVEDLTGYELSDSYTCIPVTTENRAFSGQTINEEYYTYVYHWSVDGFPWRMLQLFKSDYGNAELADDVVVGEDGLGAANSWNVIVLCSKDGITYMEIPKYYCVGEQYQQHMAICDVNTVLESTKQYLENHLAGTTVATVYNIELCYSSYFSDAADGPIQNIVMPFWVVRYWDGEWGRDLIYDGFTGEFLRVLQAD